MINKALTLFLVGILLLGCKTPPPTNYAGHNDIHHIPKGSTISEIFDIKVDGVDELIKRNDSVNMYNKFVGDYNADIIRKSKKLRHNNDLIRPEDIEMLKYLYLETIEIKPPQFVVSQPHYVYETINSANNKFIFYLDSNIHYPEEMINKRISGKIFVNFVIDTVGKVKSINLVNSIHPDADAEIYRVIKRTQWNPALLTSKKQESTISLSIDFKLVD